MHRLVCFLSQQQTPNLVAIRYFQPDEVILVDTDRYAADVHGAWLKRAAEVRGPQPQWSQPERLTAVNRASDASALVAKMIPEDSCDRWTVSLTGGTKPTTLGAWSALRERRNVTCAYVEESKPKEFVDIWTGEALPPAEGAILDVTVLEFLRAYGRDLWRERETEWSKLTGKQRLWPCASAVAASCPTAKLIDQTVTPPALLCTDAAVISALRDTFCLEVVDGRFTRCLGSCETCFLTGGWLEIFMAGLLHKHWEALEIDDLHFGVYFGPSGDGRKPGTENDLDVAFTRHNRLHYVECKSGGQKRSEPDDVLYKTAMIIRSLGALRAQGHVATTVPKALDPATGELTDALEARGSIYKCRVMAAPTIRDLAGTDDGDFVKEVFFGRT
jgi:hypothetical protein